MDEGLKWNVLGLIPQELGRKARDAGRGTRVVLLGVPCIDGDDGGNLEVDSS